MLRRLIKCRIIIIIIIIIIVIISQKVTERFEENCVKGNRPRTKEEIKIMFLWTLLE